MEFECQNLLSWTELAKVARLAPHTHACEVAAVTDALDSHWRHLLLPEEGNSYLL